MRRKLILFDWGNIVEAHITGYTCKKAWNDLFRECGYTGNEEAWRLIGKYKLCSIKNKEEFEKAFELMKEEFCFNKTFKEFIDAYKKIFENISYYKGVAEYEVALKDRCYIGILSNLTILDKDRLDKQVGLSNYDYVFLSFEMGLEKPNMDIFEEVQRQIPFTPNEVLFIDDKEKNVDSGSKMGWNTLQATGLEFDKIKEKCEEFLNK